MDYPILYDKKAKKFTTFGKGVLKSAFNVCITEVMSGEYFAEFDLPPTDTIIASIAYDDIVKIDGQLFRVRVVQSGRDGEGTLYTHIKCMHVWYDACDCKYIHHAFTESDGAEVDGWIGMTPREIMERAFSDTPFMVGDVEIDTPTDIFATRSNPAEVITQLIEKVGGYLKRDNYTVHLLRDYPFKGREIVCGDNLISVSKDMDDSAVITRLYPLGRDDMDISSVNGGVSYIDSPFSWKYGYVRCGYKNYPDISDPAELKAKAEAEWSTADTDGIDKPRAEYTVESPDLAGVSVGERVRVTDRDAGVDIITTVCQVVSYPYEPHRGNIKLSNHKDATVSLTDKIIKETATLNKITDDKGNIMSQYIDNIRSKLQSVVDEETASRLTLHEFGDLWVDDLANPTKAMVITDALFAVANSRKANGDWNWRTIGTADSFTADTVNAEWLNAGYINTDKITVRSEDGNTSLSGDCFTITTPEGFEARISAKDGFSYIFSRDSEGNPRDYITLDHKGQKRYWKGHLIPSAYQFAKGLVECEKTTDTLVYGAIELKGGEWAEVAKVYEEILADTALSDFEKSNLINSMFQINVTPDKITGRITGEGAVVVLENEILTKEVGNYTVPLLYPISASGTRVDLMDEERTFFFDGALLLYYGAAGYVRESGSYNRCYSLRAAYDIAVTLDIDYESKGDD